MPSPLMQSLASHPPLKIKPGVYIVGAGPGDPELLTVKAYRLLTQADVIVFADSLVPEAVLDCVRLESERVPTAHQTLEDIAALMVARVQAGKSVVRLHSGDPGLYGAVQEQMQALMDASIPFEVVPGISAFQLASARLRVEFTIPELVQTIILTRITGRTEVPKAEELAGLAAHQATLCLYLSARHGGQSQHKLLQHYPPQTPVAICFRLGWPDERIVLCRLDEMAAATEAEGLIRTTLYVISPALAAPTVPTDLPRWGSLLSGGSGNPPEEELSDTADFPKRRSHLYNPEHDHLFRPQSLES
jgi:precorrin-4/cobalt-precorrin-4 C11-methyltransferase